MRQAPEAGAETGASTDALNNPVKRQYTRRADTNAEMPTRALDPVEETREPDIIVADASMAKQEYLAELAFMAEPVEVILHRSAEKNPPTHQMVAVNGRSLWVQVEQPTRLPRAFVEVMARAQRTNVATDCGEDPGDALTFNRVQRHNSSAFAFSVINDPSGGRGADWLRKVMRET